MTKNTFRSAVAPGVAIAVLLGIKAAVVPVSVTASIQSGKQPDAWVITVPKRRIADAPPAPPPSLPSRADSVVPLTIDVVVRRESGLSSSRTVRQRIARTATRIHMESDGREWLFERNPIDPRRVAAAFVEHRSQAVILYEETDLRMALGIRGWADVLALGFDRDALSDYRPTGETRTIGGVRFTGHVVRGKTDDRADVWWSDAQGFSSDFVTKDGNVRSHFSVERIRPGVDADVLTPAPSRFPRYRVYDLAGWLDRH